MEEKLEKKVVSAMMLILLIVISMSTLACSIQPVKASGTIYIRADGSVEGTDKIQRDGDVYTFTSNVSESIVVERDNIIVDGEGYTLQGMGGGNGIDLSERSNVTIKNTNIKNFESGMDLWESSNNSISHNNITANNWYGIRLDRSGYNSVSGNNITNNSYGISLAGSGYNSVSGNNITNNRYYGILLGDSSSNNSIIGNIFVKDGLVDFGSYGSVVADNTVNGKPLVYLEEVSDYTVEDAGQVVLVNCNRITVENLNLSHTAVGVQLLGTNNTTISGNNITANNEFGVDLDSSLHNSIDGNNITANNGTGISLSGSSYNTISRNNITNNRNGVYLGSSAYNTIIGNTVANNEGGIGLCYSSNTKISGNHITNNDIGVDLNDSPDNRLYHNNFIDNTQQVYYIGYLGCLNVWDDGYPSGGNHWSDYDGTDANGDGIGDTPYVIDANNQDRYPLMSPWTPLEHDLVVSIAAPASLSLGSSSSLNATVTNQGLNNEVNVELLLLINGSIADSTTIPLLKPTSSYTLSYLWTPTVEGTYNVTAYSRPAHGETSVENNKKTIFITLSISPLPGAQVGFKAGDWIKLEYTISGWPSGQPYPEWLKVEFLSVEGTSANLLVTMHMSNGTEQNATVPVDVVTGGQALGLSGFAIPANLTTGDFVYITGYGNVTIAGETTGIYAGASRTAVYASISQYGTQLTYYWDKQTGVMVEASTTSGGVTATAKATETNMWQAQPFGLPIDPTVFYALIIVAIVIVAALAFFMIRRKKKPPEEVASPQS